MKKPVKKSTKRPSPTDADRLLGELRRVHDGDPWHGPSRAKVLEDVTVHEALWSPGGGAHSIWETVLHMRSWTREVVRRALGGAPTTPVDGDWPEIAETTEAAWRETLASLDASHEEMLATVRAFPVARFTDRVGATPEAPLGTGISYRAMLNSLAQHDIYHTGQLSLLKRLARAARGVPMPP